MRLDQFDGLFPVRGLADYLEAIVGFECQAKEHPDLGSVVGKDDPDGRSHGGGRLDDQVKQAE
jgi:hypothetical protein